MNLSELNWFDVENYLKTDDRIMIVLGACEQHGYLSLATDVKIPAAIANAASQRSNVLVAPTVNFGVSPYFLDYPGTISLRIGTYIELVTDILTSLIGQGFKRFLIVNGHGGNDPVRGRLYEVMNSHPEIQIRWYSWFTSHTVQAFAQEKELKVYHAGWAEAFPFCQVAELPSGVKTPPEVSGLLDQWSAKETYGDGVFGGPYQVSADIMNEMFNIAVEDILHYLKFE